MRLLSRGSSSGGRSEGERKSRTLEYCGAPAAGVRARLGRRLQTTASRISPESVLSPGRRGQLAPVFSGMDAVGCTSGFQGSAAEMSQISLVIQSSPSCVLKDPDVPAHAGWSSVRVFAADCVCLQQKNELKASYACEAFHKAGVLSKVRDVKDGSH
ncbi:hypothetical protein AOLI_G00143350 [Acnodon oligacanthus]